MKAFPLVMMLCLLMPACGPSSALAPHSANTPTPEPAATATHTPNATPTIKPGWLEFQGEYLCLLYPDTWSLEVLAGHAPLLRIEHNSRDVNMNIAHGPIDKFRNAKTLNDVDKAIWHGLLRFYELAGQKDKVKLESHQTIKVSGQPATKRVFAAPLIKDQSQTVHKMLVLVVKGSDVYQITANAAFESDLRRAEIMEIIDSIQFTR